MLIFLLLFAPSARLRLFEPFLQGGNGDIPAPQALLAVWIQAAHKQQPDNPAILDSLGWAYYLQGDLDKALEYLESAYQKFKNAEVGAHLGTLYWQKGRQDEARKVWREGWQKEPDNQILQQTLKQFGVSFTAGSTR